MSSSAGSGLSGGNSGSQAKNWCFTLNNYTDADVDRLTSLFDGGVVTYMLFGREVGESGTPHLQGFCTFKEKTRFRHVRAQVGGEGGRAHIEVARFPGKAIPYCRKDGDFTELGKPPTAQGARSDLLAFMEAVKSGSVRSLRQAREVHPAVCARYSRFAGEYIEDHRKVADVRFFPLYVWQARLWHDIHREPDSRQIVFIVDPVGNSGKSWFAGYCESVMAADSVQILNPAKRADLAHALNADIKVFFLDAPRCKNGEFIQYDFLEQLKDGRVFSTKYESRLKRLNPVHVVVLMNEHPNMQSLSADRYDVRVLGAEDKIPADEGPPNMAVVGREISDVTL